MSCFGLFGDGEQLVVDSSGKRDNLQLTITTTASHMCAVCGSSSSKYCCPACLKKTCSLTCVRKHKEQDNCTGRKTVSFKRVSEFTDKDLVDDYFLLEEVNEGIERAARMRKSICKTHAVQQRDCPSWLLKLKHEARLRGTRIRSSPSGSSRAIANRTMFQYKSHTIYWTLEWMFNNELGPEFKITDDRISENEVIGKILSEKLHSDEMDIRLQPYAANADDLIILLRHSATDQFHEVDKYLSLKKLLLGKSVIDFPTFVVTHRNNRHLFREYGATEQQPVPIHSHKVDVSKSEAESSSSSSSESDTSDEDGGSPQKVHEVAPQIPAVSRTQSQQANKKKIAVVQEVG